MKSLVLQNFNQFGLCQSTQQASPNSLSEIVGIDLHSESGVIKVNQAIKSINAGVVGATPNKIIAVGTDLYLFCSFGDDPSNSGEVYKYDGTTLTNVHSTTYGITDAFMEGVYIYYLSYQEIGRWDTTAAWATATDNWDTLNNSYNHHVKEVNGTFYITDGSSISQLEGGVFTTNALDLQADMETISLGEYNTGLLIGTKSTSDNHKSKIYWWNTYSESYSFSDDVFEGGVNSFFSIDNAVICNVGEKGKLYYFNGSQLVPYYRMNGNWDYDHRYNVRHNAVGDYHGQALFGLSYIAGDSTKTDARTLVYSITKPTDSNTNVISGEFFVGKIGVKLGKISCIATINDVLYVCGVDSAGANHICRIDNTTKYPDTCLAVLLHPYLATKNISFGKLNPVRVLAVLVYVKSKPTNSLVRINVSANNGYEDISDTNFTYESTKGYYKSNKGMDNVYEMIVTCGFESTSAPYNNYPEIEAIEVLYE